jgi:hypothetical protein
MTQPILCYIAGPYRSRYGFIGRCLNIFRAWLAGRAVTRAGAFAVVPHCCSANYDGLQSDEFFLDGTMSLLRRCDAVLMLPAWRTSSGSRAEHDDAHWRGIPVFYSVAELKEYLEERVIEEVVA